MVAKERNSSKLLRGAVQSYGSWYTGHSTSVHIHRITKSQSHRITVERDPQESPSSAPGSAQDLWAKETTFFQTSSNSVNPANKSGFFTPSQTQHLLWTYNPLKSTFKQILLLKLGTASHHPSLPAQAEQSSQAVIWFLVSPQNMGSLYFHGVCQARCLGLVPWDPRVCWWQLLLCHQVAPGLKTDTWRLKIDTSRLSWLISLYMAKLRRVLGRPLPIFVGDQTPNPTCTIWKPPKPHHTRKRGAPGALPALVFLCTPKCIRPIIS